MKRLTFGLMALCALASCAKKDTPPAPDASAELNRIADDYLAAYVAMSPFIVTFIGIGDVVKEDPAAMEDNSIAGLSRFRREEDTLAAAFAAIDESALGARADRVLYDTLEDAFAASTGMRVCRLELWTLNHMSGWQNSFPLVAAAQPIETPVERAMALARWRQLPTYLKRDQANLTEGLEAGYSAPKRVVARVIGQLDTLAAAPPEKLPFIAFAMTSEDTVFAEKMRTLAETELSPAIIAYRDFLRDDYLPKARDALSISALPNGPLCYEALLRSYHRAAIGGEATFERGKKAVAENTASVVERGSAMFGLEDLAAILERAKEDPANRFGSEQQLLDFTRALEPAAREKVAPFFSHLPEQPVIVEPFADYLKGTGQSSRYESKPAADGPAIYRINTDEWATQTKGEAEIVLAHEAWPGHHLQIATAYALDGLHPIIRLLGSTAFIEGWGRYSEALAEEAGLYDTGYGSIMRRAWPARGMVVDPGLHLYGWTNDEAKAFLIESGRFDDDGADAMLDRIAVMPGQLTAYDTGGLEIAALRAEALERLGARFDIQTFHDRVLENGAVPLGALRAHVETWIAEEESKAP